MLNALTFYKQKKNNNEEINEFIQQQSNQTTLN